MLLSWQSTYDVHDCPSCGAEHRQRRVWTERGIVFVICPRTWRRIRVKMRRAVRTPLSPGDGQAEPLRESA